MRHTSNSRSSSRPSNKPFTGPARKGRICRLCADTDFILDYKEPKLLGAFVSERGKLVARRLTGNCAFHQRRVGEAIKRARILALMPYTGTVTSSSRF